MPTGFELAAFKVQMPETANYLRPVRELIFALSRTEHTTQPAPIDLHIPIEKDWQDSRNEVKVSVIELTRPDERPIVESRVSLGSLEEVREIDEKRRASWWSRRWSQQNTRSLTEEKKKTPKPLFIDEDNWL